ncbi:hypothetical protein Goshw_016230 [Gossypium schwendimanii]|uniref:Selenoprotein F n=1 Tax=Gossypium schwendimanii TaxID=34291 RepID=A0A7J9M531_GOSSC|nr:hypothetical protein [Gossypium schwendimanii]
MLRFTLYYWVLIFILIPSASFVIVSSSKEQLSSKQCEDLGFTGLALCSDCNTFSEYVKDKGIRGFECIGAHYPLIYAIYGLRGAMELISDCLKCCTEDSDDSTSKITYSGAILEVCMRKLVFYPEIVGFIEEEKDKFPTVKVQYLFNSPPKLIMLDDEGQYKETIRIDNWKREHMLQFLQKKVQPYSASS